MTTLPPPSNRLDGVLEKWTRTLPWPETQPRTTSRPTARTTSSRSRILVPVGPAAAEPTRVPSNEW